MSRHILLREHGECIPISTKAVLRIEGNGEYVTVILKNGKRFENQVGSIGYWKKELKKILCFVKINRSHIVNYYRVVSFSMKSGVLLCLCSVKEFEKILAMKASEEKISAIKKNTLCLPLNTEGFLELKMRYEMENGMVPSEAA